MRESKSRALTNLAIPLFGVPSADRTRNLLSKSQLLYLLSYWYRIMVRKVGVEPTRYCYHQILSLERLPIPPLSHKGSPSRIRTCDSLINSQVLYRLSYRGIIGPDDMIRTCDILLPKQALYQAELHLDNMVRMEGIEPSRYYYPRILSPIRLPIPSRSHSNCGVLLLLR